MRIAVCAPQVPFEHGGAELFTETLVAELQKRGHEATLVTIPFKWYPGTRVLSQALLWRMLDLEESNGRKIDLVVGTKFPSYAVRHPNKVIWCVHQFRQAYDFDRTELGQFSESPEDRATIEAIRRMDEVAFGEAKAVFATSQNVAGRIRDSIGFEAEVMPHPAQTLAYRFEAIGDFVLSVGRLDRAKRVDLLLEAAKVGGFRVIVAGDGPERQALEQKARALGIAERITFEGRVTDERLADLYATCGCVFYAPIDEDFGMVPYEAFLSGKPVVTTNDSGGPLEVVIDRETGTVVIPAAATISEGVAGLLNNPELAKEMGERGQKIAATVTWDSTIERLLAAAR
jgi:glycosyltransferase involved in cell wall biosynthesis